MENILQERRIKPKLRIIVPLLIDKLKYFISNCFLYIYAQSCSACAHFIKGVVVVLFT